VSDSRKLTSVSAAGGGKPAVPKQIVPCPAKDSMTQAEAQSLMDEFKKNPDIPFDYPVDCCYARAAVMTDEMEKKGFASDKLWSQGNFAPRKADGKPVVFPGADGQDAAVTWNYHVAPLVKVDQPGGGVEQRVLDPSLSDRPLSVDEWKALCGPASGTVDKVTPPNGDLPFDPLTDGKDYPVKEAKDKLQNHIASRDISLEQAEKLNFLMLTEP
jgi:hypothetical protein